MTPRHIWSGGWEAESEEDARRRAEAEAERLTHPERYEAPTTVHATTTTGAGGDEVKRTGIGRGRIAALATVTILAIAGGAFAAGTLLRRRLQGIAVPTALPAVSGKPIKPAQGPDPRRRDLRAGQPGRRLDPHRRRRGHRLPDRPRRARSSRTPTSSAPQRHVSWSASAPTADAIDGEVHGRRPVERPRRRAASTPAASRAASSRCSSPTRATVAGRRPRDRDRQPVRPRPHRHRGHRLRPRARDPGAQRLLDRRGDPDRRADQPRQLRRPAARRRRPRDRRQLADRDRGRRRATSASASPCRPTPCARSCRGWSSGETDRARRTSACRRPPASTPTQPDGAEVATVVPGGPADERRRADRRRHHAASTASRSQDPDGRRRSAIADDKPGRRGRRSSVERDGRTVTLDATLGTRPAQHAVSFARARSSCSRCSRCRCWPSWLRRASSATGAAPRPRRSRRRALQPSVAPRRPRWRRHVPMLAFAARARAADRRGRAGRSAPSRCRSSAPRSCSRPTSPARCPRPTSSPAALSPPSARRTRFVDRVPEQRERRRAGLQPARRACCRARRATATRVERRDRPHGSSSGGTATGEAIATATRVLRQRARRERQAPARGDRAALRRRLDRAAATRSPRRRRRRKLQDPRLHRRARHRPRARSPCRAGRAAAARAPSRVPPDPQSLARDRAGLGRQDVHRRRPPTGSTAVYERLGSQLGHREREAPGHRRLRRRRPRPAARSAPRMSLRWFGRLI